MVAARQRLARAPDALAARGASRHATRSKTFTPDVVHYHEPFAPTARRGPACARTTSRRSGRSTAPARGRRCDWARQSSVPGARSRRRGRGQRPAAAATIEGLTGAEPCDVLFNGFETERFVETARERSVEIVVFFVGRLEQRKGVATVIEATREHNARAGRPWRLVIAGDGPERARLEALAARDGRIVFLGRVSDEQKRSWMRRVHVLVAPSTHGESFGLVLLEGMASETLVVASDIDGYREAAGGHATLFHPGDAPLLEHAVAERARRRERRGHRRGARVTPSGGP